MRYRLLGYSLLLVVMGCAHPQRDDLSGHLRDDGKKAADAGKDKSAALAGTCNADWECGEGSLCIKNRCVAITAQLEACRNNRVHFDFDASTLHPEDRPVLERIARCLKADRKMHIVIDGNTDERGTLEYNLALGDKRARTVAEYLRDLGVSEPQMATVTYGKDRPLCSEHEESCWEQNRRADLVAKK